MADKNENILVYLFAMLWKTMFLVGAGLVFAISLSVFIQTESIEWVNENINIAFQIFYAEMIGFIAPGPRYIIYPILVKLVEMGVGSGVIITLIGGHVLIEPSTSLVESGFFGWRFPLKRFLVSFIITYLAGLVTVVLEVYCGLNIL